MLARDTLVSVQPSHLFSNSVLRTSVWFNYAFLNLRDLVSLKTTDSRKNYLAAKRREKRADKQDDDEEEDSFPVESMPPPVSQSLARRVGPESSPEPEDETPRIPSIADPDIPSAGSKLYYSCRETTTQSLGNHFCTGSLMSLFDPDPQLSWVTGRHETPRLHWRDEYLPPFPNVLIEGPWSQSSNWEENVSAYKPTADSKSSFPRQATR